MKGRVSGTVGAKRKAASKLSARLTVQEKRDAASLLGRKAKSKFLRNHGLVAVTAVVDEVEFDAMMIARRTLREPPLDDDEDRQHRAERRAARNEALEQLLDEIIAVEVEVYETR